MRGNTQARDTKQNILLYIVFAIRHPRRTFQQLLRRDFIELCKGDQIGGVGIAEAVLPRGNGLAADTQCFRHKLLRHLAADTVFLQCLARDLATAFFSSRTSLELTYFLSAFTIRIWKHGKKRTYVGTKVRRQHRLFVCRGLESGKKTKIIPVFYRMLQAHTGSVSEIRTQIYCTGRSTAMVVPFSELFSTQI